MSSVSNRRLAVGGRQDAGKVDAEPAPAKKRLQKIIRLKAHSRERRAWVEKNPEDRIGANGKPVLSNRTDNQWAKMSTDKGVVMKTVMTTFSGRPIPERRPGKYWRD